MRQDTRIAFSRTLGHKLGHHRNPLTFRNTHPLRYHSSQFEAQLAAQLSALAGGASNLAAGAGEQTSALADTLQAIADAVQAVLGGELSASAEQFMVRSRAVHGSWFMVHGEIPDA